MVTFTKLVNPYTCLPLFNDSRKGRLYDACKLNVHFTVLDKYRFSLKTKQCVYLE